MCDSVSSAVSQVLDTLVRSVASSASSKPDFTSAQSFLLWLEAVNVDIKIDPDTASHFVNAWSSEIIALAETSINGELYQVFIDKGFMLTISTDGSYLRISVVSDGVANPERNIMVNYSDKVSVTEWHRIRFEAYDPIDDGALPVIKVFVDDDLYGESTIYYRSDRGVNYNSAFSWFKIYSKAGVTTDTYVDNVYCSREHKEYVKGDDDISDLRDR